MNRNQIMAIARAVTDKFSADKNLEVSINEKGAICIKKKKNAENLLFSMYYAPKDWINQNEDFIFTEISKGNTLLSSMAFSLDAHESAYGEDWYIILSKKIIKEIDIALNINAKESSI